MEFIGFTECDTCAAKMTYSGTPVLCSGCAHNWAVIQELHAKLKLFDAFKEVILEITEEAEEYFE